MMKNNPTFLNTLLAGILGLICLIACVVRTFAPAVQIPPLNIPNIVLISVLAILPDYYLNPDTTRRYLQTWVLSSLTFGLLPFAAGFASTQQALIFTVIGGVTFTLMTFLFTSIQDRLSSGPATKCAPLLSAFCLYLAAQCMTGIFL